MWRMRTRSLPLGERTLLAGIVNVTLDSFSDGGRYFSTQAAVDHALRLMDEGADLVDVGGESTRPGAPAGTAAALAAAAEQERVVPVIAGILRARPDATVSVDTYRACTARAAVEAGAEIVNDVSGMLWDPAMAETCASLRCGVVLMHTRGLPGTWAGLPPLAAEDVVPLVIRDLGDRLRVAATAGVARERVMVDPGFGFGKRGTENWALLAGLSRMQALGLPVLAGLSRKGFLRDDAATREGGPEMPADRDAATHAAGALAILGGARVLRVHDVRGARVAAEVADRMRRALAG